MERLRTVNAKLVEKLDQKREEPQRQKQQDRGREPGRGRGDPGIELCEVPAGIRGKEMVEYSQEDADEVFRHVYATLKAAIAFFIEMKVANPEGAKRFSDLDRGMIGLHTSLKELWIDYDADEQEEKNQE